MTCHNCGVPMYEDPRIARKWWCRCGSWRLETETAADIVVREAETARVMAMLDAAIEECARTRGAEEQRESSRRITAEMESTMGQTIQTRGCSKCGGTMYRIVETDSQGNPTNASLYCCNGCGHMEG